MDNTEVINVLSFCTGYAGLELGLSRVFDNLLRCVAVEIEAFACANLVAKAEEGKLGIDALYTDCKTFPAERFRGCFDIVTAGYPCQPFSHAGKRQGESDPRHLWPFIKDSIEQIEPLLFIGENVAGHLSLGFDRVVRDMEDIGYSVTPGIYAAAETGAPHRRERLFFLAYRECDGLRWLLRQARQRQDIAQLRQDPDGQIAGNGEYGAALENATHTDRRSGIESVEKVEGCRRHRLADTSCELGNTSELGLEKQPAKRRKEVVADGASGKPELANPESGRCGQKGQCGADTADGTAGSGSAISDSEPIGCDTGAKRPGRSSRPDADRSGKGPGLADSDESRTSPSRQDRGMGWQPQQVSRWPARPGQEQYEWECPRTLPVRKGPKPTGWDEYLARISAAAQSELGGTTNGLTDTLDAIANRVDRLRLCGNGVSPPQAEMAIRDLISLVIEQLDTKTEI